MKCEEEGFRPCGSVFTYGQEIRELTLECLARENSPIPQATTYSLRAEIRGMLVCRGTAFLRKLDAPPPQMFGCDVALHPREREWRWYRLLRACIDLVRVAKLDGRHGRSLTLAVWVAFARGFGLEEAELREGCYELLGRPMDLPLPFSVTR